MDVPLRNWTPQAISAIAGFVRDRLAGLPDSLGPLWRAGEGADVAARQLAMVIVEAAAPFASTTYSRARLIRQMHASGLLCADEVHRPTSARQAPDVADGADSGLASGR
jgi:hypothetical protein